MLARTTCSSCGQVQMIEVGQIGQDIACALCTAVFTARATKPILSNRSLGGVGAAEESTGVGSAQAPSPFDFASTPRERQTNTPSKRSSAHPISAGLLIGLGLIVLVALGALLLRFSWEKDRQKQIARHLETLDRVPKAGTDWQNRLTAIDELSEMGTAASAAIPALRAIRDREDWPEAYEAWERKLKEEEALSKPWMNETPRRTRAESMDIDKFLQEERERSRERNRPPAEMAISGAQFVRDRIAEEREHATRALVKIGGR